jgi:hypothetical protein
MSEVCKSMPLAGKLIVQHRVSGKTSAEVNGNPYLHTSLSHTIPLYQGIAEQQ